MKMKSFGRNLEYPHQVQFPAWIEESFDQHDQLSVLPFGLGRSYGDSCLNENNRLISTKFLNRFIAFSPTTGTLRCEAGVSLMEILELVVPHGWFIAVTPGTKHVTVGGAIANDVHGKNHHAAGSFGHFVNSFGLKLSSGESLICSPVSNVNLFEATIGGLGLTGLITWAEIQLKRIRSSNIDQEVIRYENLSEFFSLSNESASGFEYCVAWIDCFARGSKLGRGLFMRGNHAVDDQSLEVSGKPRLSVPFDAPNILLNKLTLKTFNTLYYRKQIARHRRFTTHYEPYFYPLDSINDWNRLYGRRGLLQYQCVVPVAAQEEAITEILSEISRAGLGSFLAVLKTFGSRKPPGLLSFSRPGSTLALDFPDSGSDVRALMDRLDEITIGAGGAIYPAKDARMSASTFRASFPNLEKFSNQIDPGFSSSFWRRVNK